MKINKKILALQYCCLQGAYWSCFCVVFAFATIFLRSRNFTNAQVGIVIALGNICGVILQPYFASIADNSKKISLHKLTALLTGIAAVLFASLYFINNMFIAVGAIFLLTDAVLQITQPLINSVSVYYVNRNVDVNFGLARGIGSVSYAAFSSLIGKLIDSFGTDVIIFAAEIIMVFIIIILLSMPVLDNNVNEVTKADSEVLEKESILHFFIRYKDFSIVLVGITLWFFFHNMTNNFMIQIIEKLGGTSADLGTALSIAAVVELPTMVFFSKLLKHFTSNRLLIISGIFFTVKAFAYVLCLNTFHFYLAQLLQFGAFALYIPASVYYVNETMEEKDKFKGQAVMTGTNTLGGVFGSLLGGFIVDYLGVIPMLWIGFITTLVGTILVGLFARKK